MFTFDRERSWFASSEWSTKIRGRSSRVRDRMNDRWFARTRDRDADAASRFDSSSLDLVSRFARTWLPIEAYDRFDIRASPSALRRGDRKPQTAAHFSSRTRAFIIRAHTHTQHTHAHTTYTRARNLTEPHSRSRHANARTCVAAVPVRARGEVIGAESVGESLRQSTRNGRKHNWKSLVATLP